MTEIGLQYRAYSTSDATTAATVWETRTKRLILHGLVISTGTAGTITLYDENDTLIVVYLAANGGFIWNNENGVKLRDTGNSLKVKHSAAGNIAVTAIGKEIVD